MFHTIAEFEKIWSSEMEATEKIFKALTDESLDQKVTPDGRSLGRLAWHITTAIPEMAKSAGLHFDSSIESLPLPSSAEYILNEYINASSLLLSTVKSEWKDESLDDEISMYGESWTRSFTLMVLMGHQTHHRGQMTVLMRQAGLKVPGIMGPSKEEWAQFGMQAQD